MASVVDELLRGRPRQAPPGQPPAPPQADVVGELLRGGRAEPEAAPQYAPAVPHAGGYPTDIVRSLASGATASYADEIAARAAHATGIGGQPGAGPDYKSLLEAERARDKEISPWIAAPAQIVGGITGAVALGRHNPIVRRKIVKSITAKLPGWVKASGLGALWGGAYASGAAEGDVKDRAAAALTGAEVGAATGGVLYPVGKAVGWAGTKVYDAIMQRWSPAYAAQIKLAEATVRGGQTGAHMRGELQELGPQATLADLPTFRDTARGVAGIPGEGRVRAQAVLEGRVAGGQERVNRTITQELDPRDFYAAEEAFLRNMRETAGPMYQEAYGQYGSLMTPQLKRLLGSRVGRDALKEAAFISETERAAGVAKYLGAVDDELTEAARFADQVGKLDPAGVPRPGILRGFSLETWDRMKRGFDMLLEKPAYRNELTGKLNSRGHAVNNMRRALISELDKVTGGSKSIYAQARKVYAGEAEALGALRAGRKGILQDPEIIERDLAALSDAGQEAYRAGFARSMRDVVAATPDTASAARGRLNPAVSLNRSRLHAAFPDAESYRKMLKILKQEKRFAETRNYALAGSPTAEKAAAQSDVLQKAGGALGVLAGGASPVGHPLLLAGLGRKVGQALVGPRSGQYQADLARRLFNRNQTMNKDVLDQLLKRKAWNLLPEEAQNMLGRAILNAVTQQEGRAIGAP